VTAALVLISCYAGYKIYQHVFSQDAKLEQEKAKAQKR